MTRWLLLTALATLIPTTTWADPAQRTQRAQARKEARTLELLQRGPSRDGVEEQAVDQYLDRFGHLNTRPVRRVRRWDATLPPPPPPTQRPLAIPER